MTLLLRNHEIRGLMALPEYIKAVEEGYREVGLGQGVNFPRQNLWIQGDPRESVGGGHLKPGTKASFKFKAALLPGLGGAGIQPYTAGLPGGLHTQKTAKHKKSLYRFIVFFLFFLVLFVAFACPP